MRQIQLQFVLGADWASRVIAWYSAGGKKGLSHVDAVWPEGGLLGARSDNVGGEEPGVRIRPVGYEPFAARAVATLTVSDEQHALWEAFLRKQIGKPYDSEAIWAFALNRDWRAADSWICSELQARALEVAGIVPRLYLACSKITPVALALAVSAAGAVFAPA